MKKEHDRNVSVNRRTSKCLTRKGSSSKKWTQENIIVKETDAYGTIEFHGAGKRTRAKVSILFSYDIMNVFGFKSKLCKSIL